MNDTTTPTSPNGQGPESSLPVRESTPAVAGLRSEMAVLAAKRDQLEAALNLILPELRKYEKAIAILEGTPLGAGGKPTKPKASTDKRGTAVGDERMKQIKQAILTYAEDHEEFRQVDLRSITGLSSSIMATVFETLRQENVVRFARQQGNNKYFRLTNEQIAKQQSLA